MKSYSHPATRQDLWVLDTIGPGHHTFVEVGGYDGVTHSNTLLLEECGWHGILIEGVPEFCDKMTANRHKFPPGETSCKEAVIGDGQPRYMYVNGEWSGLIDYMSQTVITGHKERRSQVIQVDTVPLSKFTRGCDYLSLDTEGSEYEILRQWFFDGGHCRALTVEFNYDADKFTLLCQLCEQYGMHLDEVRGFDLCFLKNES
jgi:hypothetical protein